MNSVLVAALYKFVDLPDFVDLKAPLLAVCESHGVKGTLLLAREGINGTIAGSPAGIHAVLDHLKSDARLATLEHKESTAAKMPFYRMKVRLKREIVTLGVPGLDPSRTVGEYVKPEAWNALIDDPEVVVIDTRNDYEVAIGTFKRAINPDIKTFRELPQWLAQQPGLASKPKVAMFCTGGIRCEKSTAYLKSQGFDEVYHLQGGILKYLEVMPETDSRWEGECFVFDERVSVGHGLKVGAHEFCRSCRHPISAADKASPHFELGVSCPHCHDSLTDERRHNLRQRQLQVELAARRGEEHIGVKFEPKRKLPDEAS